MRVRIDSTEEFSASTTFCVRRGENEIEEHQFAALPEGIKRKLRILERHGVLRLREASATAESSPSQMGKSSAANS
jgi:hypothetical protein